MNDKGIARTPQQSQSANQTTVVINEQKSNSMGTAGFVLALLGIFFSWIPIVDFIFWLLGLIFSFVGLFKEPRGLAITGFVLSVIDIFIMIAILETIVAVLSELSKS
jgi:hypothetical protein